MMELLHDEARIAGLTDDWHSTGDSIGFVPTMGALHEGHLSLVREARARCRRVVVSIFVNPIQFGPSEDLLKYPRRLDADCSLLQSEGADAVFAPDASMIYPPGYATHVDVEGLTSGLCGASRPGHFRGVTTVCCILFNMVKPDLAFFGEKDYQQLVVIRRMARDLRMGLEIVACPTVREADGLAMSSRNAYLSKDERSQAALIHRGLRASAMAAARGESDIGEIKASFFNELSGASLLKVSYLEAVDAETLLPGTRLENPMRLITAVYSGGTRLIDNIHLEPPHFSRRT